MSDVARITGGASMRGTVRLPGCKGISHRALILAGMAEGQSTLTNLATGADVAHTVAILREFGVTISRESTSVVIDSPGLDNWRAPETLLDCGNSGSAMRFFLGLLAGRSFESTLIGDASLSARPMGRVVRPLREMGAQIDGPDDAGHAPLTTHPAALHGQVFTPEIASAQVKTALLFAGLQAEGATSVQERLATRDHTERMLAAAGVDVAIDAATGIITVGLGRRRPQPFAMAVPGDPSTAAFFAVAAAMTPGSEVVVRDVSTNPMRLGYLDVLARMGAAIEIQPRGEVLGEPVGDVTVRGAALRATVIAGPEIPNVIDELPILAVAAAIADGETVIANAAELRVKESDRIATTTELLHAFGADVIATDDGFRIHGPRTLHGARVSSHGDHRIAMSAAVAGLAATGVTTVEQWSATGVSAPEFAAELQALGVEVA